jgi:hypothetical protein
VTRDEIRTSWNWIDLRLRNLCYVIDDASMARDAIVYVLEDYGPGCMHIDATRIDPAPFSSRSRGDRCRRRRRFM